MVHPGSEAPAASRAAHILVELGIDGRDRCRMAVADDRPISATGRPRPAGRLDPAGAGFLTEGSEHSVTLSLEESSPPSRSRGGRARPADLNLPSRSGLMNGAMIDLDRAVAGVSDVPLPVGA